MCRNAFEMLELKFYYHIGTVSLVNQHLVVGVWLWSNAVHFKLIMFVTGPAKFEQECYQMRYKLL